MIVTLKNEENKTCTVLSFEQTENGSVTKRVDLLHDNRKRTTIEEYGDSWNIESVRFFFVSEVNALISNGYKVADIK